jgi:site-specific DNA-cytosine methylase
MNVLSLFDGISCGQVALERARIKVDNYFASEIEKKPIEVTQKNYPNTFQLGDVTKITEEFLDSLPPIDLLIGGSPCQDLSVYKYDRGDVKGLEGKKSSLFYQFERIMTHVKPRYFLLENVPMEKEWQDIITELLGVEPILINSNLVAAADRKRLYWTNIPNVTQPEDKGIIIGDIIVPADQVPEKYWYDKPFTYNGDDKKVQCTIEISGHRNMKEVYNINGKCNTLLADGDGGNRQKKVYQDGRCRKFMPIEYERMQTLPDNYTDCVSDSPRYSAIGNGWTVDVIAHIFRGLNGVK